MPTFRLINTVDCDEEQALKLIKDTNGEQYVAGWKGYGKKFKVNTALIFEVMCENKPQSQGNPWRYLSGR